MFIRQFFVKGLAHASYLVGCMSSGICAVIDPKRDVEDYLEVSQQEGLKLTHIFETHMHADFVSGHLELVDKIGAQVYVPAAAKVEYNHVPLRDGDEVPLGSLRFRVIETPGHTPEGICLAVSDITRAPEPWVVFTGDTLFVGDVGRPDLFGPEKARELAAKLYHSLQDKLLKLPDSVEIYPAHGAGSLCGRSIGNKQSSTIGFERRFNYALLPRSEQDFVEMMTKDMPEAPAYFKWNSEVNRKGPRLLRTLMEPKPIEPKEAQEMLSKDQALLLDTRSSSAFGEAHIPGGINIGLSPLFPLWVGTLVPPEKPLLVLLDNEKDLLTIKLHLARVGYDNLIGFIAGGILACKHAGLPLSKLSQITVSKLRDLIITEKELAVLDVRTEIEWSSGHIKDALHLPLNKLSEGYQSLPKDKTLAVICGSGYRSSIATSILEGYGFGHLYNVIGGMGNWNKAGYETVT
jgi:glyoxylase-like metal-dependent hydrolase (beta-lactamase superfamily II)